MDIVGHLDLPVFDHRFESCHAHSLLYLFCSEVKGRPPPCQSAHRPSSPCFPDGKSPSERCIAPTDESGKVWRKSAPLSKRRTKGKSCSLLASFGAIVC
jgi:hypothetical protein